MKYLFAIFLSLFSLTVQEISIEKGEGKCADINDNILYYLRTYGQLSDSYYHEYYGYNVENCNLRYVREPYTCCYMNIYSKKNEAWFNFCGKVKLKGKGDDFLEKFFNDDIYTANRNYLNIKDDKEREKYIKIDCFSEKINAIRKFVSIALILLL